MSLTKRRKCKRCCYFIRSGLARCCVPHNKTEAILSFGSSPPRSFNDLALFYLEGLNGGEGGPFDGLRLKISRFDC